MKDLDNETPVEISQLCPRVSTSEFLRAILLFGLLFGMVALASLPQGILPTLALFSTQDTDTESSPTGDHAASQLHQNNALFNERSSPSGFLLQRGTSAQTVQATVAHSPNWATPINQAEHSVPETDNGISANTQPSREFGTTPDNSTPFGTSPHIDTGSMGKESLYPPLEGVTATGFTGWGYQQSPRIGGPVTVPFRDTESISSPGYNVSPNPNGLPTPSGSYVNPAIGDLSAQIQQLGALRYRLERWGNEGELFRFWCEMPLVPGSGTVAFFEAIASQPEEAMENVIRQVRNWLKEAENLNHHGSAFHR